MPLNSTTSRMADLVPIRVAPKAPNSRRGNNLGPSSRQSHPPYPSSSPIAAKHPTYLHLVFVAAHNLPEAPDGWSAFSAALTVIFPYFSSSASPTSYGGRSLIEATRDKAKTAIPASFVHSYLLRLSPHSHPQPQPQPVTSIAFLEGHRS